MPATNSHQLWSRSAGGAVQQVSGEISGHKQAMHHYDACCWPQECGPDRQAASQLSLAGHP